MLGVPAGCVDRPSDMRGPPVTADRYIRSGAVQPNGVEVQLETKKGAKVQKKKHGFLRSHSIKGGLHMLCTWTIFKPFSGAVLLRQFLAPASSLPSLNSGDRKLPIHTLHPQV